MAEGKTCVVSSLPERDGVQLVKVTCFARRDAGAHPAGSGRPRTRVELPELPVVRSLRVRRQPCALELHLQAVAQSRTQGDPERDPLHPGPAAPPEALLSREAGVLRAPLHARPVQRHGRGGGGGGGGAGGGGDAAAAAAAAGCREGLQWQGSRARQESAPRPPARRLLARGAAVPRGPADGPQPRARHGARHQLPQ